MSLVSTSPEVFEAALAPFTGEAVPDGEAYQRLSGMVMDHPLAARLASLDPFSDACRDHAAPVAEAVLSWASKSRSARGEGAMEGDHAPADARTARDRPSERTG